MNEMMLPADVCRMIQEVSKASSNMEDLDRIAIAAEGAAQDGLRPVWVTQNIDTLAQGSASSLVSLNELMQNACEAELDSRARRMLHDGGRVAEAKGWTKDDEGWCNLFPSPRDAVASLFPNIPHGRLEEVEGGSQDSVANEVASVILESGEGDRPTFKIRDGGVGQTDVQDTFLKFTESNKRGLRWMVGRLGVGSAQIFSRCRGQIILTKRAPWANGGEDAPWIVVLARRRTTTLHDGTTEISVEYLCFKDAGGRRIFPAMPHDTEVVVEETEWGDRRSAAAASGWIREKEAERGRRYREHNPGRDLVRMECRTYRPTQRMLEGTNRQGERVRPPEDARVRYVAHTRMRHGTLRILVECEFPEKWAQKGVGEDSTRPDAGLWYEQRRSVPDPILPWRVVENRWSDESAGGPAVGKNASPPMFGQFVALTKKSDKRLDIDVPCSAPDGQPVGVARLTAFHFARDNEFKPAKYSPNPQNSLFKVLLGGQTIGLLDFQATNVAIAQGSSTLSERFLFFLRIDGLTNHREFRNAGRTFDQSTQASRLIVSQAPAAAKGDAGMRAIAAEWEKDHSLNAEDDRIVDQLALFEDRPDSSLHNIEAFVKGDVPKQDDKPTIAYFNRRLTFARGKRELKNLNPVRVARGRRRSLPMGTTCRTPLRYARGRRKGWRIELSVHGPANPGVECRADGGRVMVSVAPDAPPDEVVVLARVTDGGFTSKPAIIKLKPEDPPPALSLLPEPTFLAVARSPGNTMLHIDRATPVRFRSDAAPDYGGHSAEVAGPDGLRQHVGVAPDKDGRWTANVPVSRGASAGDKCVLTIRASRRSLPAIEASAELTVVASKPKCGGDAARGRQAVQSLDVPEPSRRLHLKILKTPDDMKTWGFDEKFVAGLGYDTVRAGEREWIAFINWECPIRKEAMKQAAAEKKGRAARAAGVRACDVEQAMRDFDLRLYRTMSILHRQARDEARAGGRLEDFEKGLVSDLAGQAVKDHMNAFAMSLELVTSIRGGEVHYRYREA